MRRIRKILDSLLVLSRTPSTTIRDAWTNVKVATSNDRVDVDDHALNLIGNIIEAVIGIAKEDEDKATKSGKADKPEGGK